MISDDEIQTATAINNLRRKIHRAIKNEDDETFVESYLELVELSPDLFEMLDSLCGFFNKFQTSVGGASN